MLLLGALIHLVTNAEDEVVWTMLDGETGLRVK